MRRKIYKILFLPIMVLFISCHKTNTLEDFFKVFENRIENKNELLEFKNASKDSVDVLFKLISKPFIQVYRDSTQFEGINKFFNDNGVTPDDRTRGRILIFGFHRFINDEQINLTALTSEVKRIDEYRERLREKERRREEEPYLKIVKASNELYSKGDTMNIILPVSFDKDTGMKSTYYSAHYPYTLDYSDADDTLKVTGILLDKRYENTPFNALDSLHLIFKLKLIELSDTNYHILWRKYQVGDEFDLHLRNYGRPME